MHSSKASVDSFQGLLSNFATVGPGQLGDHHPQSGSPPQGIFQTETVNLSDPSTNPSDEDPGCTHSLETSAPMDINQSRLRLKMHTCYNCSDKGHLSHDCLKTQKQRVHLTVLSDIDTMGLMANAIGEAMDAKEVAKKTKQVNDEGRGKRIFRLVNGETHALFDQ